MDAFWLDLLKPLKHKPHHEVDIILLTFLKKNFCVTISLFYYKNLCIFCTIQG